MIRRRRAIVLSGALLIAPAMVRAQAACRWSDGDPWVRRQSEFFNEAAGGWTNDSLRTALLSAANVRVPLAAPVQRGVQVEGREGQPSAAGRAMIAQLNLLAAVRGSAWPTRSVVGAAGTHAVYVLAQYDTALMRSGLHRAMEAGPVESPAADVAAWEDRLRLLSGRKQIYGTQFRIDARGNVVLAPMEDSAHADLRREDAGLPPFKLGLCFARNAR